MLASLQRNCSIRVGKAKSHATTCGAPNAHVATIVPRNQVNPSRSSDKREESCGIGELDNLSSRTVDAEEEKLE